MHLIAIVVVIFATILIYCKWLFGYWSRKGVPTPKITIPFGNVKNAIILKTYFGNELRDVYFNMKTEGLKFCGYYILTRPVLIVIDLELVKTILNKDFLHFVNRVEYANENVDPLSDNLFTMKGVKWKNLRSKLTPMFTSGKMKMMFHNLVDCSKDLVISMDKMVKYQGPVDIKEMVGKFTTDVIGSCAFGVDCNSLKDPNSEFRIHGKKATEFTFAQAFKYFLASYFPEVLNFFNLPLTKPEVTKFFLNFVNDIIDYREKNNVIRKDFIHLMIQLKNKVKIEDEESIGQLHNSKRTTKELDKEIGLSIKEIAAQSFVFFLGGFEAPSVTLTFCLFELALNHKIQTKVRQEIQDILEKHQEKVTYAGLMEMTYMEKCLDETLRKYPPPGFLTRECTQPYQLPGSDVVLEKGTQVFIPLLGIQGDPEYYPDPEKFDPERFSPENKSKRHSYTWLPFGEGPRICIGVRFAIMQIKVALVVLLKNCKFSLNDRTKLPVTMDPTSLFLTAEGGIWLDVEKVAEN